MRILSSLLAAAVLAGCTGEGDTVVQRAEVPADSPNSFLTYPNTQATLGAGSYTIIVGTDAAGANGQDYTLTITLDDGSVQVINGTWAAVGTTGPGTDLGTYDANGSHAFEMDHAGGATFALESAVDGHLFLLRNGTLLASDSDNDANGSVVIDMAVTPISSATYAQAYYDAVDAQTERDTLAKWKDRNGFNDTSNPNISITHVTFRDALDLGYGRDMYVLRERSGGVTQRIAFFVNNYVVQLQPGSSSNYGPLNVDAAISEDARFFRGTNAIEFSPANEDDPTSPNGDMKITKFFTYDKSGNRITSADLDGRGVKHMPGMCWACHGGQTMPLDENRKFQPQSLRSAKYNILGAGDFEYSLQDGYHRDQMEARIRTINSYVHESYLDMQARPDANSDRGQGKWAADYALELVNGRYNSNFNTGTYNDDFVPEGWKLVNNPGAGVDTETLFKRVVGPHCTACHSLQGRKAAAPSGDSADNVSNAINFSSFEKFYAYRSRIADYVFRRGIMPLGLRNFEDFWEDPDGAPAILAGALGDTSLFSGGKVIQPGLPVARPGADRTVRSPVQLDGSASYFAQTYLWEVVGSVPMVLNWSFSDPTSARPVFTADDGDYQLRLTVTNSKGSDSVTFNYTVNNTVAPQTGLTFVDDIRPIFEAKNCTVCHTSGGTGVAGIPVYWSDEVDSNGVKLYQRVMERVDRRDPENSRLLRRPTSFTHGGGLVIDLTNPTDRVYYNTIVNWIREGAVCGTGTTYGCAQ
jgi:cytochrome c5